MAMVAVTKVVSEVAKVVAVVTKVVAVAYNFVTKVAHVWMRFLSYINSVI